MNKLTRLAVKKEKMGTVFYLKNYTPLNPLSRGEKRSSPPGEGTGVD